MLKLSNRKNISLIIFILILISLGIYIPQKINVIISNSLDKRFFYIQKFSKDINLKYGDYVIFILQSKFINNNKPVEVTKKVGCVENENLEIKYNKHYFCNGKFLGIAKDKSKKGEPVENYKIEGPIQKGYIFVIGDHPDSYDSKYFGPIKKEEIKYIAYPIF